MNALTNVHLELTSKCINGCYMCPRTILKGTYDEKDISLNVVQKILDVNPKNITMLGNWGDPIYHAQFPEIINLMGKHKQKFIVRTIGTGFDIDWWGKVYNSYEDNPQSKSSWGFTLDGLKHSAGIYRVGANFDQTFNAMKLGARLGKSIIWNFIVLSTNENDVHEAKILAEDHGIVFRVMFSDRLQIKDTENRWAPSISEKDLDI